MRLIMTALLMIFLTSCRSVERRVICAEIRKQEIAPVEMCDIQVDTDVFENLVSARCRCRQFDINSWTALTEPVNHPLWHCNHIAGYRLEAIATEVRPKVKALYRLKENLCQ